MKTWKIIYYIGDKIYDVVECRYQRKPHQLAKLWMGLAERFTVEEVREDGSDTI